MVQQNGNYGELLASMELDKGKIILVVFFRLIFCSIWWSVWFREPLHVIAVVVLVSLPVLLSPLVHFGDKIELYQLGLLRKNKFYTWEKIGGVQFQIFKANDYRWIKVVKMSTNCKVFNVTFLKNPMDIMQSVTKKLENIENSTEKRSTSCL